MDDSCSSPCGSTQQATWLRPQGDCYGPPPMPQKQASSDPRATTHALARMVVDAHRLRVCKMHESIQQETCICKHDLAPR